MRRPGERERNSSRFFVAHKAQLRALPHDPEVMT